jgi:hypothetical protein
MSLHHFNGEAMPDVSTAHATLFARQTVYIAESFSYLSPGAALPFNPHSRFFPAPASWHVRESVRLAILEFGALKFPSLVG